MESRPWQPLIWCSPIPGSVGQVAAVAAAKVQLAQAANEPVRSRKQAAEAAVVIQDQAKPAPTPLVLAEPVAEISSPAQERFAPAGPHQGNRRVR